jgi:hypothetical protein
MSTLSTTNLKNPSSSSNNIILAADGSTTITTLTLLSGTTLTSPILNGTISGTALASTSDVNGVNTTGTVTASTTSLVVASATGITAGMFVVGEGIAPGTTVSSIASTTVTLSANANTTLSADPVAFYSASKILTPAVVGSQLCRAWVNFNGTGTVAIRASFNVSSITDNGTGDFTVNFTTAMVDANYSCLIMGGRSSNDTTDLCTANISSQTAPTTSVVRIRTFNPGVGYFDFDYTSVSIFR